MAFIDYSDNGTDDSTDYKLRHIAAMYGFEHLVAGQGHIYYHPKYWKQAALCHKHVLDRSDPTAISVPDTSCDTFMFRSLIKHISLGFLILYIMTYCLFLKNQLTTKHPIILLVMYWTKLINEKCTLKSMNWL